MATVTVSLRFEGFPIRLDTLSASDTDTLQQSIKVAFAMRLEINPADIISVSLQQEAHPGLRSRRSVASFVKQKKASRVSDRNRRSGDHDEIVIAVVTMRATEQTSSVPARAALAVPVDAPIQVAFDGVTLQASYTGTPALVATTACTNSPIAWVSSDGEACHDYASNAYCTVNGTFGLGWDVDWGPFSLYVSVDNGLSATDACCACGAGTQVVIADMVASNPATAACANTPGWTNVDGESCETYQLYEYCNPDGSPGAGWSPEWESLASYDGDGAVPATEACCICGGGNPEEPSLVTRVAETPTADIVTTAQADMTPTPIITTLEPVTHASRRCVNTPVAWTDDIGDNCYTYSVAEYCVAGAAGLGWDASWGAIGDYTSTDTGTSSIDACCECGGGRLQITEEAAVEAAATCLDYPTNWLSTDSETCAQYREGAFCNGDGTPGPGWNEAWGNISSFASLDGRSAIDVCCVCGGGRDRGANTLTLAPSDHHTEATTLGATTLAPSDRVPMSVCLDRPVGWVDGTGDSCDTYTRFEYCTLGGEAGDGWFSDWGPLSDFAGTGHLASTAACCGCGGGNWVDFDLVVSSHPSQRGCKDQAGWQTDDGEGCDEYLVYKYCNIDGSPAAGWSSTWGELIDYVDSQGATALDACCVCGGGNPVAIEDQTSTSEPAPALVCLNTPIDWKDGYGDTCAVFEEAGFCTATGEAGVGWDPDWGDIDAHISTAGVSPATACCACGGGRVVATGDTARARDNCYDRLTNGANWTNQEGEGCAAYQVWDYCTPFGEQGAGWDASWGLATEYSSTDGTTAFAACCFCGGGDDGRVILPLTSTTEEPSYGFTVNPDTSSSADKDEASAFTVLFSVIGVAGVVLALIAGFAVYQRYNRGSRSGISSGDELSESYYSSEHVRSKFPGARQTGQTEESGDMSLDLEQMWSSHLGKQPKGNLRQHTTANTHHDGLRMNSAGGTDNPATVLQGENPKANPLWQSKPSGNSEAETADSETAASVEIADAGPPPVPESEVGGGCDDFEESSLESTGSSTVSL